MTAVELAAQAGQGAAGAFVTAQLEYLADLDIEPVRYNPPPGTGEPTRVGHYGSFPVRIQDGRPIAGQLSLDRESFILVEHRTAMTDFFDPEAVRETYYREIEQLVMAQTGATKVVVFDHTIRVAENAVARGLRAPVEIVHNDYTPSSGPRLLHDLLEPAEAEQRASRRFAEYNFWRPIAGPVQMFPLAIADARSVAAEDLAIVKLVYADRVGEIFQGLYNRDHSWWYFPHMQRTEGLLFKCFDSETDGRARFSLHTAFKDPTTPADAPPRQSIEARALALF